MADQYAHVQREPVTYRVWRVCRLRLTVLVWGVIAACMYAGVGAAASDENVKMPSVAFRAETFVSPSSGVASSSNLSSAGLTYVGERVQQGASMPFASAPALRASHAADSVPSVDESKESPSAGTSTVGEMAPELSVMQPILALLAVFGAMFAIVWILKKGRLLPAVSKDVLKLIGCLPLGGKAYVAVVEVGGAVAGHRSDAASNDIAADCV